MDTIRKMERLAPLEERIRDELLAWIKEGHLGADQQLPSEAELAANFGVSRATIRAALSMLASRGIVIRKHGSGTYFNPAMLRLQLLVGDQWEFQELIRSSGYQPGIHFIDSTLVEAGSEEAAALNIEPGQPVLRVHKIFTADGVPAIDSINILSHTVAPPPYDEEKLHGPIFPFLEEYYHQVPTYSVTDIHPVIAGDNLGRLLQVPPLSPLLLFKDIFFNADHVPILYAHNHFTSLLHFKVLRQPSTNWI